MVETSPPPPDSHSGCARRAFSERCRTASFGRAMQHKPGAGHPKRREDALPENLKQRFPGHDFDDAPENVRGVAVAPKRTGLSGQWQAGNAFGKLLVVKMPLKNIGIQISLLDQIAADIFIGNA